MTTRDSGCRSCWFSRRGAGGLQGGHRSLSEATTYDREAGALGQFREVRRGFVPITCLAVLDLGLPEGRSLGPMLGGWEGPWAWLSTSSLCWSRAHAPGLVLSLGAKVDSKQTPCQGKASSDRFDPGSFFSPLLWKGGLGEGSDVAQLRIGVGLGGALLPTHGRRQARSLTDGTLVKLRG